MTSRWPRSLRERFKNVLEFEQALKAGLEPEVARPYLAAALPQYVMQAKLFPPPTGPAEKTPALRKPKYFTTSEVTIQIFLPRKSNAADVEQRARRSRELRRTDFVEASGNRRQPRLARASWQARTFNAGDLSPI